MVTSWLPRMVTCWLPMPLVSIDSLVAILLGQGLAISRLVMAPKVNSLTSPMPRELFSEVPSFPDLASSHLRKTGLEACEEGAKEARSGGGEVCDMVAKMLDGQAHIYRVSDAPTAYCLSPFVRIASEAPESLSLCRTHDPDFLL